MEFRILGPLEVVHHDGGSFVLGAAQQRALLAVLVLHRSEIVSIDRLVDELWGERASATAAKTVHVYVSRLRKELGSDVIATQGRGYRLLVEPEHVDVGQFEALCSEGRRALGEGDAARARERLCSALGLWWGEPLADFAYEPFAQSAIGGCGRRGWRRWRIGSRRIWRSEAMVSWSPSSSRSWPRTRCGSGCGGS